ncbi:isochorismate synthase MenF [Photobacterium aphoticum]|uniref:Isochorismate synthase MenF n=1 Tax=Photobacterium aphoticum TaxID=754436 RepID=A0A0J1GI60_9GAMM|nr:isochorismate synthase [Photobacterium aphoticum]KLU99397.1 isochorismate synthase [Photobacterium aphoticum]PSU55667.1 isochorismate synthase [Photobacterium aphoticum]GHA38509.1 isochorismate synthase [Photobacterium aphoticum]
MTALQKAVEFLINKIQQSAATTQRLTVKLELPANTDLIDWMESQPLFPKFYWQSRDSREEVVALGQIRTFTDPKAAEQVLDTEQRIWGGRSFDGRTHRNQRCLSSFFFLPVLEVSRVDGDWQLAVNLSDEHRQKVLDGLAQISADSAEVPAITSKILGRRYSPDFSGWSQMISNALDAISNKVFEKVVLARKTTLTLDAPVSPAQLLKASRSRNHHSFHFMMAMDAKHCFVGSTPERLFLRQERDLHTEAVAGTTGRGANAEEDANLAQWLLDDSKNRYENRLVVDDIVSRLVPRCSSMNVAQTPELIQLRKVQHLKRGIDAQLNDQVYSAELLESLQPTAAIAGLPRDEALAFISENEPFARGWYSGAVGFLSGNRSEFCVAIRSALIMDGEVHLFAGAGIVPGSTADSEWKELDRKTSTLCSLLASEEGEWERKTA